MAETALIIIIVGSVLLYPARLAFTKEVVGVYPDEKYVHKKTIAIVFSVLAIGFILIGFTLLFLKLIRI